MKGLICADRIDIAQIRMIEEAHFTYQSIVYFGVADLNILLEFSISSGENRIFSLSSLLSCFGGLFSFMSLSTWLFVVFSFSIFKYNLTMFLLENAYCVLNIVVSNLYSHVWSAILVSLSIKLASLLRLEFGLVTFPTPVLWVEYNSNLKVPFFPSYSKAF